MSQDDSLQTLTRAVKARISVIEEELPRLRRDREAVDLRIAQLEGQLVQLSGLLESSGPSLTPTNVVPLRVSSADLADRVVRLLEEVRRPMHYREIESTLRERGDYAGRGQDPANALLATYFADPRLRRVSRGTYVALGQRTSDGDGLAPANFLNRKIQGFTLKGRYEPVSTYKDLLMAVLRYCEASHSMEFERVLGLRGSRRPYFSRNPEDLRSPAIVGRSGIYTETNLSANDIVRRCREVLSLCGEDPGSLRVQSTAA